MWIRREFTWEHCEMTGMDGWMLNPVRKMYEPGNGFSVAHDTLEHFTSDGTLVEEAQSFATILWGRGEGGFWSGHPSPNLREFWQVMAGDMAQFIAQRGSVPPVRTTVLDYPEVEHQIVKCGERAKELFVKEGFGDCYDYDLNRVDQDVAQFCNWIRVGYRRTLRRWSHSNNGKFLDMFYEVEHHPLCKGPPDCEWDKLAVSFSPARMEVKVRLIPHVYPYP